MNRRSVLALALGSLAARASAQPSAAPEPDLAAVQGDWRGKLTYRDYARPDRLVTLPTRLFVALAAPSELVLHYVFDDGPSKTVYAYERMALDFENKSLAWTSGFPSTRTTPYRITASRRQEERRVIEFERDADDGAIHRHVLSLSAKALTLGKEEGRSASGFQFRNRFEFGRGET